MNFIPSVVAIVFEDSMSSQRKTRHRVLTGVRKRSASIACHHRRVSRAFTRWSNNFFGLFREAEFCKVGNMSGIFPSCSDEDKRIRPEKPVIKHGIFPSTSR
jgi:hypothetical protein